jgi:hypothetical protein
MKEGMKGEVGNTANPLLISPFIRGRNNATFINSNTDLSHHSL